MESLKNVYCEKMGLFRFLAEKFFLWRRARMDAMDCCEARRWSARSACEAFRAASVCVWMDVPGRVWMDAMEVVHV